MLIIMTKCNSNFFNFSSLSARKVQANFSGGSITSDAGSLLLREVDKKKGLITSITTAIDDRR